MAEITEVAKATTFKVISSVVKEKIVGSTKLTISEMIPNMNLNLLAVGLEIAHMPDIKNIKLKITIAVVIFWSSFFYLFFIR